MKELYDDYQNKKQRRNYSDVQSKYLQPRNHLQIGAERKYLKVKVNSIKINRSKLPSDFFPRTQSLTKKVGNKKSIRQNNVYLRESNRKVQSQRLHISPEKTSFFGIFQQNNPKSKNHVNTLNLKRIFESRQDPKRQKIIFQKRNFTPLTGIQRHQLLDVFPAQYDSQIKQAIATSSKIKGFKSSPRKQQLTKYKDIQQSINYQRNQFDKDKNLKLKDIENEQMYNITFFNSKSTAFPPINKKQGQN